MSPSEQNFNWVTARNECSIQRQFECLRSEVEKHTKEREGLLARNDKRTFLPNLHLEENKFSVARQHAGHLHAEVTFELRKEQAQIHISGEDLSLEVTITLSNDGECLFLISRDGEKMNGAFKRWQVAREALETLFFGLSTPYPTA